MSSQNRAFCKCKFPSTKNIKQSYAEFLRVYGDNLPEKSIKEAVKKLDNWQSLCDCKNPKKIVSVGHWVQNDWYLCTIKNLATHKGYRGQGLGTEVVNRLKNYSFKNGCLVLAADVTTTNAPSKRIFEKAGFESVNKFCWSKKSSPADILHYVKTAPKNGKC